jgi:hypothetical protein
MKRILHKLLFLPALLMLCSSCNDEWKDEQYERYISFKSPLNGDGVTPIYVRYKENGSTSYKLPVIVSGSTTNDQNITVYVAVDSDTLDVLNYERFQNRTDLYYKHLEDRFFDIPETVNIKAGEDVSLLNIDFTLNGIDLVDKWLLPLTVVENSSYGYAANPRKHYRRALLKVMPFNDYSGTYGGTALMTFPKGSEYEAPIVRNQIPVYVVDENTVFFYAGFIDEDRIDRHLYKILATFHPETMTVTLRSENPDPRLGFTNLSTARYSIRERMDATRPYLLHRYITISRIGYEYKDYTAIQEHAFHYIVGGSMVMERKINTQIPDEDQAFEW